LKSSTLRYRSRMRTGARAVLLTGLFGTGKSTVAADIADVLEGAQVAYAALDLDWLTWTNAGGPTRADEHRMMLRNLEPIVTTYLDAGATHFVLARSIQDRSELTSLAATIDMPLRTVELDVPYDEIARRIVADPTDGRRVDLARTASAITQRPGSRLADVTITNDRTVRDATREILDWLEWPSRGT
jgi:predicted kinase